MFRWNFCDWSQSPIIPTTDLGHTGQAAMDTDGRPFPTTSGMNIVDVGTLAWGICAGAVACTYTYGAYAGPMIETRMRLNHAMPWTVGVYPGWYDIWSVVAHEAGHSVAGARDLYPPQGTSPSQDPQFWQVMFGYVYTNDNTKRVMALGDYSMVTYLYAGLFY